MILNSRTLIFTLLCFLFICSLKGFAQEDLYNHSELAWKSFETKNFIIYFEDGLNDVAEQAAEIAEEIHEPLCKLYNYRPDTKVSLIFSDTDDISNAASYFQNNKIRFWASSMNWDLRGTHNWLRNVVTHEYTHMIQLGATRKWSRQFPAAYLQIIGYEPERRPDVLQGYPNVIASWPIPSVTVPAWFAEGTAQFQFNGNGYDFWDSHRDMMLRQATLSNRLLTFNDMGYFGKTSLESEGVYNQGFSLTKYIAEHGGGAEVLQKISHAISTPLPISLDKSIQKATGKSGNDWYNEWKADLEKKYGDVKHELEPTLTKADTIPVKGYVNLYPRISPDGKKIAFISNQNRDYYGQSSLYIYDFESKKSENIAPAVQGGISWLPDGSAIVFSRRELNKSGSTQFDLYAYRFEGKKEFRLTKGMRAESADVSPDGKWLVFTVNEQGRREIAFAPMPELKNKLKVITQDEITYRFASQPYEQYYTPRWSPDGKQIAVAQSLFEGRGIKIFDVADNYTGLTLSKDFSGNNIELRDPCWSADGKSLLASWDISGISNIYKLDIKNGNRDQLTSVLGGALYPDIRGEQLVYSDFCEWGFRVCSLNNPTVIKPTRNSLDEKTPYIRSVPVPNYSLKAEKQLATNYKPNFENIYWFPRLSFDYNTFKPGTYVLINDVLDKLTFIGGFAINQKKDYDLFGSVEYKEFYPTIFAEYYNIQRRITSHFADSTRILGEDPSLEPIYDQYRIRYRYNLDELDFGLKIPLGEATSARLAGVWNNYTANNRFDDGTSVAIKYFKGWAAKISLRTDARRHSIDSEINPSGGFKAYLEYTRANHQFFTDLKVGGDVLGLDEVYAPYNYDMLEGGYEKYLPLPGWKHTLELRAKGGFVGESVDPFFYLYAGGLPGMRGYSFYSLGGTRNVVGTATYRLPIVERADWNLWPLSINRIYGSVFTDIGNAWVGDFESDQLKKDIGAGIRVQMHSFYSYPTSFAFDVAYGFDKFKVKEDNSVTEYGKELRYYFTLLFSFYSPFSDGNVFEKVKF